MLWVAEDSGGWGPRLWAGVCCWVEMRPEVLGPRAPVSGRLHSSSPSSVFPVRAAAGAPACLNLPALPLPGARSRALHLEHSSGLALPCSSAFNGSPVPAPMLAIPRCSPSSSLLCSLQCPSFFPPPILRSARGDF